jgi:hypothetical protein
VQGTASDPDDTVVSIDASLDGGAFTACSGTTSWVCSVAVAALAKGKHTLVIVGLDDRGASSQPQTFSWPFDPRRLVTGRFLRLTGVAIAKLSPFWSFAVEGPAVAPARKTEQESARGAIAICRRWLDRGVPVMILQLRARLQAAG